MPFSNRHFTSSFSLFHLSASLVHLKWNRKIFFLKQRNVNEMAERSKQRDGWEGVFARVISSEVKSSLKSEKQQNGIIIHRICWLAIIVFSNFRQFDAERLFHHDAAVYRLQQSRGGRGRSGRSWIEPLPSGTLPHRLPGGPYGTSVLR